MLTNNYSGQLSSVDITTQFRVNLNYMYSQISVSLEGQNCTAIRTLLRTVASESCEVAESSGVEFGTNNSTN